MEKIWRDHFSHPWLRWVLKIKGLVQIAWTFVSMMGMHDDQTSDEALTITRGVVPGFRRMGR